ncbi:glycoside hydrolase family 32 protein [Sinomonas sp. ASV322]|uniref:glycoside hydrolase family 32 protein n=1 Tax=Sinomonas sp. ASV322 TaxID=3041920 RepID=UPI0027DAFCF0|nr:glycoside hydrolase family 32 protein [Sinomonas sp. ASV322]MDQ4502552.1 glycoside hydrolase family 32 protein [Sinomonas sp. ASV322]
MTSTVPASTHDLYRPRLHYSAAQNWLNDPNGLVYADGVYHLFYQYNPFGTGWGNMSWGHATSTDLLTWTEHPVAIPCDEDEQIFSGSAVLDEDNTAGFGAPGTSPLVAIYTSAYSETAARPRIQAQSLAYSLDGGQTWTKHAGNPVLDRASENFRDPKVFRYEGPDGPYWVMVAVEATEQRVLLHKSTNLLDWEYLSDFTADGPSDILWECPDLFEVPIDGDLTRTAWVLIVSVNPGGVAGGSGTRYFIGTFDGVRFVESPSAGPDAGAADDGARQPGGSTRLGGGLRGSWLDWGRDYYAAVSFSGLPYRRVMIGWMSNWDYANSTPTEGWRSAMALPREITLRTVDGRVRLAQSPIAPEATRTTDASDAVGRPLSARRTWLTTMSRGSACRVRLTAPAPARGTFGLCFGAGGGEGACVTVDARAQEIRLDRTASGVVDFHELFPSVEHAPLDLVDGRIQLDVYIDACSIEVFAQGGLSTITDLVFPHGERTSIEFFASSDVTVDELEVAFFD